MPEGFVYGYEGWYGMDFVSTSWLRILFAIGDSPNQMEILPFDFRKQDLKIYAFDGRLIQDGHKIRVTGRPKYRSDDENRKCELWVDVVESLMPMEVTTPLDLQVGEIGCRPLDTARQLIRLKGSLKINRNNYTCWMNECKLQLTDFTGSINVVIKEGNQANQMAPLPKNYSTKDLVVYDNTGATADINEITLIGVANVINENECQITVYEVEPSPSP